jgi:serine/threonine protein kinase
MTTLPTFQSESRPLGGRYRLVQPLGAGGFGQTFSAHDLHLPGHPLCVVKQLKPQVTTAEELQVARRLFDTEAQVLYKLGSHPQIPGLLAHFEEDQEFYLAQEFIQGHSLGDELEGVPPWSEAQVVTFLGDLLGVLAFVHHHGVIHRDIKPSNLIRRQSDRRIVLIDFGAVKQVSAQATQLRSGLSHTISIGTQGYMPSEQVAGRPQFSSDVYAVGMLGIQALTGYFPSQLHPDPHSGELDWQPHAPQTDPALVAVLDAMVCYDFRTRYSTATEALAALRALPPRLSRHIPPQASIPGLTDQPQVTQAARTVAVGRRPGHTQVRPGHTQVASPPTTVSREPAPRERSSTSVPWLPVGVVAIAAIAGLISWSFWRSPSPEPEPESPPVTTAPVEPEPEPEAAPPVAESPAPEAEPAPDPEPEPEPEPDPPAAETPTPAPEPAPEPEPPAAAPSPELTTGTAQATVTSLYSHISNQSWDAARLQFGGSLAQQFDPGFFRQFNRVSVENLRVTRQTSDTIEFLGENTYYYPDGSTQREERTFTVQIADGQPRIVASRFQRVLQAR